MGFADAFKAIGSGLAGGLSGAAQGARDAYPGVMQSQQRRSEQADLASYRDASLDIQREGLEADKAQMGWNRAYQLGEQRRRRLAEDNERIRLQGQMIRENMRTRGDATRELYDARMSRAQRAAGRAGPQMSTDQLDRIARLEGFTDYGQVVGVLQTAGESVAAPGTIPNPGESGLDTLNRIRSEPGYTSLKDRYHDVLLEDEVRRELGR